VLLGKLFLSFRSKVALLAVGVERTKNNSALREDEGTSVSRNVGNYPTTRRHVPEKVKS
jgi:hypothetical protein